MIRLDRADVVVVGGAEGCIHPITIGAFGQMQAMSRRNDDPEGASRPWDVDRDGFVMGEGAAIFVLETLEHAEARGARIYGELAGAGITADATTWSSPSRAAQGQARAMKLAMKAAELTPADIVHVNAHATSTPQGDVTEAGSIRQALGEGTGDRHLDKVDDGSPPRRGRRAGVARHAARAAQPDGAAHDQPATIRSPDLGIDIAATRSVRSPTATWPLSTTASVSAAPTSRSPSRTPTSRPDRALRTGRACR